MTCIDIEQLKGLIGLSVLAIKGYPDHKGGVPPEYILFNDGATYIQLSEMDPYERDYSPYMRDIEVCKDKKYLRETLINLPDSTEGV